MTSSSAESWLARVRWLALPSVVFAALVFVCGWLPRSPFAEWSNGAIALLSLPSFVAFFAFVLSTSRFVVPPEQRTAATTRTGRLRWREILSPGRVVFVVAVGVLVGASFITHMANYRGGPEIVDGEYVLMDKGELIATVSRSEWLERRTDETRVMTGHFMLFGLVALLAKSPGRGPWKPFDSRRRDAAGPDRPAGSG